VGGALTSVASPAVWPLLTMPITARVRRLAAKFRPSSLPQHAAA